MSKKITFGILCNSLIFEAWEASSIEHLLQHPQIELKLLVINDVKEIKSNTIYQKIIQYPYQHFLYRVFKRFFLKAASYKQISYENKFKNIPQIVCKTIKRNKYSEYFSESDVNKIKLLQLDFMLRFGFNIIKGPILESCKYGIWSFHHADNEYIRGGPIGFWEIFLRRNNSAAVLQQLNNKLDQGVVLRKGYLKTVDHSYAENIDQLTTMAAIWPLQVCIDVLNNQDIFDKHTDNKIQGKLYKFPNNLTFIYFLFLLLKNKIYFHYVQLFLSESWHIAVLEKNIKEFLKSKKHSIHIIQKASSEHYCADPFFIPSKSNCPILFEYYSYQQQIGKIAIGTTNSREFTVFDFNDHIHRSYPYCFEYENEVYFMPEQADSKIISLYQFNGEFKIKRVINLVNNFSARDASIVFYNNKWWLFCTKANDFENAALYIFYSEKLFQEFIPHQNNPVKVDVRNARPAGCLFVNDNVLYRPAQNNAQHYGHKLNINQIKVLSEIAFEEELVNEFDGPQFGDYSGIHHLSINENKILIDLKRHQFSYYNFKKQLQRKFKKLF